MTVLRSYTSHRLLIDTSGYYGLANPHDNHHAEAQRAQRQLIDEAWRLFTTNFIFAEIHALLLTRMGRRIAAEVLADIDASNTVIIRVSRTDEQRARAIITQYDDKNFSLTDATSFAVMERLQIPAAFTFDRNFRQYGFRILPD